MIITENIYRRLASNEDAGLPAEDAHFRAASEIDRALLFSTLIMVCAFIPLFALEGPAGACSDPWRRPTPPRLAGRWCWPSCCRPSVPPAFPESQASGRQLFCPLHQAHLLDPVDVVSEASLAHRAFFRIAVRGHVMPAALLGQEFMPELEEGNLWIRDTCPLNTTLERQAAISKRPGPSWPRIPRSSTSSTRSAARTTAPIPTVTTTRSSSCPCATKRTGRRSSSNKVGDGGCSALKRPRTKEELVKDMDAEIERKLPGVDWNFSQNIRDNVMESLSGIKGDNSLKIVGPDFKELQGLGIQARNIMQNVPGLEDVAVFNVLGNRTWNSAPIRKNASDGACRWPTSITSRPGPWAARPSPR